MITINEILETPELINSLTASDIKKMEYGIEYFDLDSAYTMWGKQPPSKSEDTLRKLKARLNTTVECDCGHGTELPMKASLGTSCPDCYDRMSG